MHLRRGHSRPLSEVNLEETRLARRLSEFRWPTPPPGARERGWATIQQRLQELERTEGRITPAGKDHASDADYAAGKRLRAI
jgi:hypothetical protein